MTRHQEAELLQGTLDMLILKIVARGPMHGYGIIQKIQQGSKEALQIRQGSLYPALHRLERKKLLEADWKNTDGGREAKFYKLTRAGREQLQKETAGWKRLTNAVGLLLES